ncbi:CPBP family intramembrane metalloprotease [Candidatus Woesebacteria bacterium]|nr:CPBP family intramembrane metalloprotease [Candidatus Woesebacteria bacterium]
MDTHWSLYSRTADCNRRRTFYCNGDLPRQNIPSPQSSSERCDNSLSIFFRAYIYEEILFRGLLLPGLLHYYSPVASVIITSFIFGVWRLKNVIHLDNKRVLYQVAYAGMVVTPVLGLIALYAQTIWIGVILHYINNLWSIVQWWVYDRVGVLSKKNWINFLRINYAENI